MTLSTLPELQAQFTALSARIAALDREIALETDRERRIVAQEKRDELAREREHIIADIALAGGTTPSVQRDPLDNRVSALERQVRQLWNMLKPSPRAIVARVMFYGMLILAWSVWMDVDTRAWMFAHPVQAITITVALFVAALLFRWLPEDNDHDER